MNRMVESASFRLTRDGGDRGPSLAERLSEQINHLSFASPFHSMRLKGRFPLKLIAVPEDPVPGDAERGRRLRKGRLFRDGYGQPLAELRLRASDAPAGWQEWVHGWGWLRDLAGSDGLGKTDLLRAESLARVWLQSFHDYDSTAWAPAITGNRILMAICYAPLVMPRHDDIHRSAVLNGIARWGRHLDRAAPRMPAGIARLQAATGLMGCALMLPGGEERRRAAEALLDDTLAQLLGEHGSVASRSPLDLAHIGNLMLVLASFHRARAQQPAPLVTATLARVRAGLGSLAMGDGLPSAWHGGQLAAADLARLAIDPGRAPAPARASGFQRLAAGSVRIMVDAGPPPPARIAPLAHASTLAFTMSDGAAPLVVNCGGSANCQGAHGFPDELTIGLRSTAGHSTLVLADTNSTTVHLDGPRRLGGVEEVVVEARANADGQWFEGRHDGWRRRFGYYHLRRLWLAADGDDFRGEDHLQPVRRRLPRSHAQPLPVAVRFHLGPGVEARPTHDGRGALLSLPADAHGQRRLWVFKASFNHAPGLLKIEPSLFVDADGGTHEIRQLLLTSLVAPGEAADISWSFRRQ